MAENLMETFNLEGFTGDEIEVPKEILETGELQKLRPEQIEKGEIRLQFKHPLAKIPIYHVLPWLRPIKFCFKCGRDDDEEDDSEKDKKLKRQNSFYKMQQRAKNDPNADFKRIEQEQYNKQVHGVREDMDMDGSRFEKEYEEMDGEEESDDQDIMGLYD